ncbi:MAG: hypothetical protein QOI20_1160 [Acidimicrobiaceae bacterium]|nr:hypothetical protein [Acidimicrobiaceae bacterium]
MMRRAGLAAAAVMALASCGHGTHTAADVHRGSLADTGRTGTTWKSVETPTDPSRRLPNGHTAPTADQPNDPSTPSRQADARPQRSSATGARRYTTRVVQPSLRFDVRHGWEAQISFVLDTGIDVVWTEPQGNRAPERRHLTPTRRGWEGEFFIGDAADWPGCGWQPALPFAPAASQQATSQQTTSWTIDSRCDEPGGRAGPVHEHITGTAGITGTRSVTVDGTARTVTVIHRDYRVDTSGGTTSTSTCAGDLWWSAELWVPVKLAVECTDDAAGYRLTGTWTTTLDGLTG